MTEATHSYPETARPHDAPEWLWYGTSNGQPVVTFGRWPKHGAVWRYKWAEIQSTEHDHPPSELPKRPFAFAVKRAPDNGPDQWRLFMDEGEAREAAEQLDGNYEGLYLVGDRRSTIANRETAYKRAWDAYVEFSMDPGKTTFDCVKAVVDAGCGSVAQEARECGARLQGTPGGNDPVDCDWPGCGCDPAANKFLEAIDEAGFEITKKREPLPWDAGSNYSYVPVETLAAEIYAGFVYDGPGNKPAWTPGGNGIKQDEARFEARRRLRAAGHTASTLSSTDPRCTCAAIVNPNIPHARFCPLSSTSRDSASTYCALCDHEHQLHEDAQGFHHVVKGARVACPFPTESK